MYIVEWIISFIKGKKYNKSLPDFNQGTVQGDVQDCTHFFMPLDNDKDYFACKHCGLVVSKDKFETMK